MDEAEVAAFLDEEKTVVVGTNGPDGWPHLMPLWFVVRAGELWGWTFAKSQKVKNLERDPRASWQVEAGTEYAQLRGVMVKADVVVHHEVEDVWAVGAELAVRYGGASITPEVEAALRAQAAKRVALQFVERDRATWDHRKLGDTY